MRSYSSPSSSAHQTTFCTLMEEMRPQILIMASELVRADEESIVNRILLFEGAAARRLLALHGDPHFGLERLAHFRGVPHFLFRERARSLPRGSTPILHEVPCERVDLRLEVGLRHFRHLGDGATRARAD